MFRLAPLARVRSEPVPSNLFPFTVIIPEPFTVIPPLPAKVAGHSPEAVRAKVP